MIKRTIIQIATALIFIWIADDVFSQDSVPSHWSDDRFLG